jgi:predicted protein tyrosine phosphatase
MEFTVYSRPQIEAIKPHTDVEHVIISIRTPGDTSEVKLPLAGPKTLGVLHLSFYDNAKEAPQPPIPLRDLGVTRQEYDAAFLGLPLGTFFDEKMGLEIVLFVRQHHAKAKRIIVHCDDGLSRSPAVVAALAKMLGQDDSRYHQDYNPNQRVYRLILGSATR